MLECRADRLPLAGQCGADQRLALAERTLAGQLERRPPEDLRARLLEPLGERLVQEAVAHVAVEIADHHRQLVGQRQHPPRREHFGRQALGISVRARGVRAPRFPLVLRLARHAAGIAPQPRLVSADLILSYFELIWFILLDAE